jgi:FeS assembly SUF system regulator
MLRLSRLSDYAVVVLLRLGSGESVQTSSGIAAATGIPEPTVAKVLKMLTSAGLATSVRGARGGYFVARGLGSVSIADVITAVDGPIALTACVDGAAVSCEVSGQCALHGHWDVVNQAILGALEAISLAELRGASGASRAATGAARLPAPVPAEPAAQLAAE